jgi:chloramphenicol 3-O-phosphotransferase
VDTLWSKEGFNMQPPTGLHIVGRLAPVDAVIAKEIFRQFRHGNLQRGDRDMAAQRFIDFDNDTLKSPKREHSGAGFKPDRRKPPQRVTVAPEK